MAAVSAAVASTAAALVVVLAAVALEGAAAFMAAATLTILDGAAAVLAASNTPAVTSIPAVSRVAHPLERAVAEVPVLRDNLDRARTAVSPPAVVVVQPLVPSPAPLPVPDRGRIQLPDRSRPRQLPVIIHLHLVRLPDRAGEIGVPATRRELLPGQ